MRLLRHTREHQRYAEGDAEQPKARAGCPCAICAEPPTGTVIAPRLLKREQVRLYRTTTPHPDDTPQYGDISDQFPVKCEPTVFQL